MVEDTGQVRKWEEVAGNLQILQTSQRTTLGSAGGVNQGGGVIEVLRWVFTLFCCDFSYRHYLSNLALVDLLFATGAIISIIGQHFWYVERGVIYCG
jgi:hypothetical protein